MGVGSRLSIEVSFCRHETPSSSLQTSGIRDAYLSRRTALRQFKFVEPFVFDYLLNAKPVDHILLDKNEIIFSQVLKFSSSFFMCFRIVFTLYFLKLFLEER